MSGFRLASLLRLRRLQEDVAAGEAARAAQRARTAERSAADARALLGGSAIPPAATSPGGRHRWRRARR